MRAKTLKALRFVWTAAMVMALVLPVFPGFGYGVAHADGGNFAGGDGSPDNPYRIADGFDLLAFSNIVNGGRTDACAVLVNDIDMTHSGSSPRHIPPIGYKDTWGNEIAFEGTFDGQWHIINDFLIDMSSLPDDIACGVGLFGIVKGVVKNVGVESNIAVDKPQVGGVAGINRGTIDNCYHTGNVVGNGYVGGVVGYNIAGGIVKRCYNTGKIVASSGCSNVGGVAGVNEGTVEMCFNTGEVGDGNTGNNVGGIVGKLAGGSQPGETYNAIISDCYNRNPTTVSTEPQITGSYNVGGIVGLVEGNSSDRYLVRNCYNTGIVSANDNSGGIIGNAVTAGHGTPTAVVISCYFSEGTPNSLSGGTEYQKTYDQLRNPDTFENWDLNGTWRFFCETGTLGEYPPMLRLMFLDRSMISSYPLGRVPIGLSLDGEITCYDDDDAHVIKAPYQVSLADDIFDLDRYTIEISYIIADKAYNESNVTFKKYQWADGDLHLYVQQTAAGTVFIRLLNYSQPDDYEPAKTEVLPEEFDETTDCIYLVAEYRGEDSIVKYSSKPLLIYPFSAVTTPPAAKTGLTYNGTAQELVTPGSASGGTMYYALGANDTDAPTSGWAESVPTRTDAGTYYVWYKVVGNSTHLDVAPACVTAEISRRPLTITVKDQTYAYNGSPQGEGDPAYEDAAVIARKVEAFGLQGSDRLASLILDGAETEIGEYPGRIQITGVSIKNAAGDNVKGNYNMTFVSGKLTITPRIISVSVTFKVVNGSWDDGTTGDKKVTLSRYENEDLALKLEEGDIPAVGGKPAAGYKAGGWDTTPSTDTAITGNKTYTYTYAAAQEISYSVTSGDGQEWRRGSGDLAFTVKRSAGDEKTFGNFRSAALDGQALGSGDFGTAKGSLVFTLKASKAKTLALGKHTLDFTFADGTASASFTVKPAKGSFEDVAVPSNTFTFKKVWQGGSEKSIDFTLYKLGDTVYRHGFDKKAVSKSEWKYSAWFSEAAACYVIEAPVEGYTTQYVNVGVYADITDRCCDGGTIVNVKIPKTGDDAHLILWGSLAALALLSAAAMIRRKKKAAS